MVTFTAVNIRKFVVKASRLRELVELGTLTTQAAEFLGACVVAGLNIVVAGGTQAGKTTLLNTLGSAVPGRERIVSVEEVFEVRFDHPDWVAMQMRQVGLEGTGEVKLRHLVKETLRMRPSRIVGGQIGGDESSAQACGPDTWSLRLPTSARSVVWPRPAMVPLWAVSKRSRTAEGGG